MKKTIEKTKYGVLPSTISLQIREPGSALTHFAGLVLLWVGTGPLVLRAREQGSAYTLAGVVTFLLTAMLLYAASSAYHTVVIDERGTTVFRKLDHISIAIMIAGSYTPICLTALRTVSLAGTGIFKNVTRPAISVSKMITTSAAVPQMSAGTALLAAIWALALAAVLLKLLWVTCPKWLSSVIYLAMGWLCIFSARTLLAVLPAGGFAWLLAGGIAYSVGAVVYALHPRAFDARHIYFGSHEIFHVFIMLGTFCHYELMLRYIACIE